MKIAVLSGKGGTGKTFISVNLASTQQKCTYIDCDVEEPNGHLYFKPQINNTYNIEVMIPRVDQNKCIGCRKCVDLCKYNALAYIKDNLMIFNDVCHSCGGCILVCPQTSLTESTKAVGTIDEGVSLEVKTLTGTLKIGEASGVPIIKQLIKKASEDNFSIIDCPPGSACIVMESIKDADYCVLVAEPTIFGRHNLEMVYQLVSLFKKPSGVILNKCLPDKHNPSEQFCRDNNIKILQKIPFDKQLGRLNSDGIIAARQDKKYFDMFENLLNNILKEVNL